MALSGVTKVEELPHNLRTYIEQFDRETATQIDLNQENLTEENLPVFIKGVLNKYMNNSNNRLDKKFFELNFINEQNPKHKQIAEQAYKEVCQDLLEDRMFFIESTTRERDFQKKESSRVNNIIRDMEGLYTHSQTLPEERAKVLDEAFKNAMMTQFEKADGNVFSAPGLNISRCHMRSPNFGPKVKEYKKEYVLETAKRKLREHGLGVPLQDRGELEPNMQGQSTLNYAVNYAKKCGFLERRENTLKLEQETYDEYHEWLWPQLQEEALQELANLAELDLKNFDMNDEADRRKFFLNVYGAHYAQNLKHQTVGTLRMFPESYAATIYHKEMLQAGVDFLALGGFQNELGDVKIELRKPSEEIDNYKYDFDEFLKPLAEHLESGGPFPYRKVEINHPHDGTNSLEYTIRIAKAIADHPGDYFKCASVELNWDKDIPVDDYLEFIDEMTALADRKPNPLRTAVDFPKINDNFYKKALRLKEQYETTDNPGELLTQQYQKATELVEKIDAYRFKVAKNRRDLEYGVLKNGEQDLGKISGMAVVGGTVKKVSEKSKIRAVKRNLTLAAAKNAISIEQEMEQEEEQEQEQAKEKEQEQEQEQEQDQQQVHGSPDDNITTYEQFKNFIGEQLYYSVDEENKKRLWHGLCGNYVCDDNGTMAQNPNIRALSKDAIRTVLTDPDAFQNGFVEGNLPQGFHFGLLATPNGPQRGIYYDPNEPSLTEENPLTISISKPLSVRPRLKASSSHFKVKQQLSLAQRGLVYGAARLGGMEDDPLEPPTQDEIDTYNKGNLFGENGWSVAGKMAICTSEKRSTMAYRKWYNDPITKEIAKVVQPQEMAEQAVSLGGDAIFDLNDKLNDIKDKCRKLHQPEMFDQFLDNFVLQKENVGWKSHSQKPRFSDHMIRHEQFKGMDLIKNLDDNDFKFFMAFFNQHAKYHTTPDLLEMYNDFVYFKNRFEQAVPGAELPTENIEEFAATCTDMKVGLNRMLIMLENAKKHGMAHEQLAVMTKLDLDYATAYSAVEHNKYRIVLPEMRANKEQLKHGLLTSKSNINAAQSAYFYNHWAVDQSSEPCKVEFYRQFGLVDPGPKLDKFRELEGFIDSIKSPEYDHPDLVKSFMYTFSGFCCYHPDGLSDVDNKEKLAQLAKTIDGLDLSNVDKKSEFALFFQKLSACQHQFFSNPDVYTPPTLDAFSSYISTINRLHETGCFVDADPSRDSLNKCFDSTNQFEIIKDLFTPIHHIATKEGSGHHKLTDKQLAHVLVNFEKNSKLARNEDNPVKVNFGKLQGDLLQAFALVSEPNEHFLADENNDQSLKHFLKNLTENICQPSEEDSNQLENQMGFEGVQRVLKILSTTKWDEIAEPYPSFENMKQLLTKAATEPFPNNELAAEWIKTQAGFNNLSFDLDKIAEEKVISQGFNATFKVNLPKIKQAILKHYDVEEFDVSRCESFSELFDYISEFDIDTSDPKFVNNIMPILKNTLFLASKSSITDEQKYQRLTKLNTNEKEFISAIFDNNYPFEPVIPNDYEALKQEVVRSQKYSNEMETFCTHVNITKENLGSHFNQFTRLLSQNDISEIPIRHFTTLMKDLSEDYNQNRVYRLEILKTVAEYPNKADIVDQWPRINSLIQQQVLPKQNIDKAGLTTLILDLAAKKKLNQNEIAKLTEMSEAHADLYQAAVHTIGEYVNQDHDININQTLDILNELTEKGVESEDLVKFLQNENACDVLGNIKNIDNVEKQKAIIQILNRSLEVSDSPTVQDVQRLITTLRDLSPDQLKQISQLDIDAQYPNVTNLITGAERISANEIDVPEYIDYLQEEFFAKKNDPKNISRLFNDNRVVDVLNGSNTLEFALPRGISTAKKEKLLSEYAYIHAIGLDKPIYNDKALKDLSKGELKTFKDELVEKIRDESLSEKERHLATLQMIALSREVYYRATLPDGRFPYSTQVISLLTALENGRLNINEIATGQGKSLTAALYATVMWAKGQPTVVCTSNLTLASEGLEENHDYYEYMGIPTSLVRAKSKADEFEHGGINYTDVSNMALFLAKTEIQGTFEVEKPGLILDEVDFTVLDEVTDFRYAVNLDDKASTSEVNLDEWFYYKINEFVDRPEFLEEMVDRDSDISNAIAYMNKQLKREIEQGDIKDPIKSHLQDRLVEFQSPGSEARKQLDTWIDSAFTAKIIYKEGKDKEWVLDTEGDHSVIRIMSHHRIAKGSKWSKGVHQFIHARFNQEKDPNSPIPDCKIFAEKSHVAALSSKNFVDFFAKRGGNVWGMTGTVGSNEERSELRKKYGFKMAQIETHQKRQAVIEEPKFVSGANNHVDKIFKAYEQNSLKQRQMPTVIFEENALQATIFKDKFLSKLKSKASGYEQPPTCQFYNGVDYEVYDYDQEKGKYVQREIQPFINNEAKEDYIKKLAGQQNTVTITTPMMGRGTDFKPKLKNPDHSGRYQDHPDGLFVIQAYAESSVREERQIQGRMGRQGKLGLYYNIVDKNRFVSKLEAQNIKVPFNAKYFDPNKLSGKLDTYKSSKNISLAEERRLKQTFGDMRGHFYEKFIGLMALGNQDKRFDEVKYIMGELEEFNETDFKSKYNAYVLNRWNRFLINIDKEFIRLKDVHKGDYEKIFEDLDKYCYQEWNKKVIDPIKQNMGFNEESLQYQSDALFAEFREFTDKELNTYATLMHRRKELGQEREKLQSEAKQRNFAKKMGKQAIESYIETSDDPQEKDTLRILLNDEKALEEYSFELFPDHQKERLAEQRLKNLDTDETIDVLNDIIKPETYAEEFFTSNYTAKMEAVLENGRRAKTQDPDHAVRFKLDRQIVNYTKHYWLQDLDSLAESEEPRNEIATMLAVDTLNEIFRLNKRLEQDKLIKLDALTPFEILGVKNPYPDNPQEANKFLVREIEKNPTLAHEKLQNYYLEKNITAQLLSAETSLQSREYAKLYEYQFHRQNELLIGLSEVAFEDPTLVDSFKEQYQNAEKLALSKAKQRTFSDLRRESPDKALQYQIEHPDLSYSEYDHLHMVEDIENDLSAYLKLKTLNKARKKNANKLAEALAQTNDMQDVLQALLIARQETVASDIKAWGTKNRKGSRYHTLLDKSITRVISSAQNKGDLLLCADFMRKELYQQMLYVRNKTRINKEVYNSIFQEDFLLLGLQDPNNPQDISLKDLNEFIESKQRAFENMDKSQFSKDVRSSLEMMESNLKLMIQLRDKMEKAGLDFHSEERLITDISFETEMVIPKEYERDVVPIDQRQEVRARTEQLEWPNKTASEWQQVLTEEYSQRQVEAPSIRDIVPDVNNITPKDAHHIVIHSKDPALWNAYFSQNHEETLQNLERNNRRFDRQKFPAAPTLESILGENKAPETPMEYFKVLTEINKHKYPLASPRHTSQRLGFFSHTGELKLSVDALGDKAKLFAQNAKVRYPEFGPPINQGKVERIFEQFDLMDQDLKGEEWDQYWRENGAEIADNSKKALIRALKSEFIRDYRQNHPEAKHLSVKEILKEFSEDDYPEVVNFNPEETIQKAQEEILAAYRLKVISNSHFIDEMELSENDPQYLIKEARCKDFLQRINAQKRQGQTAEDCAKNIHDDCVSRLENEVDVSLKYYDQLVKEGKSLDNIIQMMTNNIKRLESKNLCEYIGDESKAIIKPLKEQLEKFQAFNVFLEKRLEETAAGFVPVDEHESNHERVLDLIKAAVDDILSSQAYKDMGDIARDALKSHLTSKESIEKRYKTALDKRTEHFRKLIPDQIDELVNSETIGVKWVTYPRSRRELIANLADIIKQDWRQFQKQGEKNSVAKAKQKAAFAKLKQAYIDGIEEDLKTMPKQHAKGLLERLKNDPMLKHEGMKLPFSKDPRKQMIERWNKMVDERPDTPVQAVPDLLSEASHTGVDVNLGILRELEQAFDKAERAEIDKQIEKAEREIYDLPTQNDMSLTHQEMVDMMKHESNLSLIRQSLQSITDLDERIVKMEELFNEALQGKNFEQQRGMSMFSSGGQPSAQKNMIGMLQELYVDAIESMCLKKAHEATDMEWSDKLPDELSVETVDEIYREILEPSLNHYMLNTGNSTQTEQRMKNKVKTLIENVNKITSEESIEQDISQRRSSKF